MKIVVALLLIVFPFFDTTAQNKGKEKRAAIENLKSEMKKQEIDKLIQNQDFVFNATEMLPRGLGIVNLGYDFDVQVKDSLLISYLPFMGKIYYTNIGGHESGFDFTEEIESYEVKKKKKGYKIHIDVRNNEDLLNFTFHVMYSGFATLTLASSKRQSIAYYGTVDAVK